MRCNRSKNKKRSGRKAQASLLLKPIILILTVTVLIILIQNIYSGTGDERKKERELDLRSVATNTIMILANSEDCLAHRVPVTLGGYANIVDVKKLELFGKLYNNTEPPCARNYQFGWRAKVKEIDADGREKTTWSFGASQFSKGASMQQGIITNIPIGVMHDPEDIRPGKLEIELVDGDLERLAGFLDRVCNAGKERSEYKDTMSVVMAKASYTEYANGVQVLCNDYGSNKACRQMLCNVAYEKHNAGEYILSAQYKNGILSVGS